MRTKRVCFGLIGIGLMAGLAALELSIGVFARSPPNQNQLEQTFDQTKKLAELRRQIAGKERSPAEEVFRNIKDYKGVSATGLLRGMEFYTRALGVDCTHCHIVDQWDKEDKPAKQIAREMSALVDGIQESLKKIKNLKSERPGVSCVTCHRGQTKPAMSLTVPSAK